MLRKPYRSLLFLLVATSTICLLASAAPAQSLSPFVKRALLPGHLEIKEIPRYAKYTYRFGKRGHHDYFSIKHGHAKSQQDEKVNQLHARLSSPTTDPKTKKNLQKKIADTEYASKEAEIRAHWHYTNGAHSTEPAKSKQELALSLAKAQEERDEKIAQVTREYH